MKFHKVLCYILITLTFCCKRQDVLPESSKQDLLLAIETFNKAFQKGEVGTIESMITKNYIHTNGNSRSIHKDSWLDYLKKRQMDIISGNLKVVEYHMEEIEVEIYDKTAIVTGKVNVVSQKNNGIHRNAFRVTHTWVNESGKWKRAGFHDGKIE